MRERVGGRNRPGMTLSTPPVFPERLYGRFFRGARAEYGTSRTKGRRFAAARYCPGE